MALVCVSEITILQMLYVAEHAGLRLILSATPKKILVGMRLNTPRTILRRRIPVCVTK